MDNPNYVAVVPINEKEVFQELKNTLLVCENGQVVATKCPECGRFVYINDPDLLDKLQDIVFQNIKTGEFIRCFFCSPGCAQGIHEQLQLNAMLNAKECEMPDYLAERPVGKRYLRNDEEDSANSEQECLEQNLRSMPNHESQPPSEKFSKTMPGYYNPM